MQSNLVNKKTYNYLYSNCSAIILLSLMLLTILMNMSVSVSGQIIPQLNLTGAGNSDILDEQDKATVDQTMRPSEKVIVLSAKDQLNGTTDNVANNATIKEPPLNPSTPNFYPPANFTLTYDTAQMARIYSNNTNKIPIDNNTSQGTVLEERWELGKG